MKFAYWQASIKDENGKWRNRQFFVKGRGEAEAWRVAAHARSGVRGTHTTLREHMPPEHRRYAEWTPSRLIEWASRTGTATAQLVERILTARTYPEQGYRACLGIIRLGRDYEPERVEAAAERALKYNACSYKSVRAILVAGLDRSQDTGQAPYQTTLPMHANIRGRGYYHDSSGGRPC